MDPWPWGFPSPVRLLIPTQRASVPKMQEEKKSSEAPIPRSDRSRSGLRTHCHAKPIFGTSPCYFMLFFLSGVPHYILTPQDVAEHQGATEPLQWKNVETLYSTGLPLFSGVSLKEKEITQRGTFLLGNLTVSCYPGYQPYSCRCLGDTGFASFCFIVSPLLLC